MKRGTLFFRLALLLGMTALRAQDLPGQQSPRCHPFPPDQFALEKVRQLGARDFPAHAWRDDFRRMLYPPYKFDDRTEADSWLPSSISNYARYSSSPAFPRSPMSSGVHEAWVKHFRSGQAPGVDYATAIALDASGNVYVTGTSYNSPYGADYLTAKYDPAGKLLWTARYNGEGNGYDHAISVRLDAKGNVYVAGTSQGINEATDMVTIKYNLDGVQQWVARFDDPDGSWINAADMVLDAAGNIYVTGWTSGTSAEYITVKYNADGVQQWVARYNKARFNVPRVLAVDNSGNVYVAGHSGGEGGREDFLTVKYDANGVEQWTASYNGPDNYEDIVSAMTVDTTGNVYVMGECRGPNEHYALIKYDQAGVQLWVARLEAGINRNLTSSALVVDGAENVYAAAARVQDHDYTVVKYNPNGFPLWTTHYDTDGERNGGVVDVALDPAGNILVTGTTSGVGTSRDFTTIKYNPNGVQLWVARYNGTKNDYEFVSDLVVDQAGQVYVTGGSYEQGTGQDYTTIKYNANGHEQWVAHYNKEENSNDSPSTMTIDGAGNVYVTGSSEHGSTGHDFITIKYNSAGEREWMARYDGPAHENDAAIAIAGDAQGNVYVTGSSIEDDGNKKHFDYLTIKYNSAGTQLWAARYNAPGYSYDEPLAMAMDGKGNVYVTGRSSSWRDDNAVLATDYVTVKYNTDGVEQWVIKYHDLGDIIIEAYAITVDDAGNVYITGLRYYSYPSEFATVKYDAKGRRQWVAHYQAGSGYPTPDALRLDGKGNVYIAGRGYDADTRSSTCAVIKYNAHGTQEWMAHSTGRQSSYIRPTTFAIDISGNVYVSGLSFYQTTSYGFATVKFNSRGVEQSVTRYNGPGGYDAPTAITVDGSGHVYVTGWSFGNGTHADFTTVKYDIDGKQQWVARYNSPENVDDTPAAIAVDNWGTVYVTGKIGEYYSGYITTIKYTQDELQNAPCNYDLSQSFPNPFTTATNIRFRLQNPSFVSLKVYNLLGQEVETLVNGLQSAGEYRFQWNPVNLPNGVYVYRLQAGDPSTSSGRGFVETKKLMLLR